MKGHPSRRSLPLVDPGLQFRYAARVVLATAAVYLALGLLVLREVRNQDTMLASLDLAAASSRPGASPEESALVDGIHEGLATDTRGLVLTFGAALVVLSLLLLAYGVRASHRVAGPVHALDRWLGTLGDDGWAPMRPLRKGDELWTLRERLNQVCERARTHETRELEALVALRARALDGAPGGHLAEALQLLIEKKQARLAIPTNS
jgi:hypothetical protein